MADDRAMRTRPLLLAALAVLLLVLAAVPAGPGTPRTWGANTYGQLGDGTTTRRTSPGPGPGPGLSGVETVTAGRAYSAAL